MSKERALLATNDANQDQWERLFLVASAKPAADALRTGEPRAKLDYGGFGTKPCLDHRGIGYGPGETLSLYAPALRSATVSKPLIVFSHNRQIPYRYVIN